MKILHPAFKLRGQSGFTFIEVIMVVVILGILSSAAAPRFLDIAIDAKRAVSAYHYGTFQSAMKIAFVQNRVKGIGPEDAEGAYITDCDSLVLYLDGDILPQNTKCVGVEVTFPDGEKATITPETKTTRAFLGEKTKL